ncbi:hypothetical protein ACFORG_19005 [Lutimaribacter marinistellae]|uniref:Pilus assembly protein PilZ n=1 Tax=Lutimaribacter marinistellae TaxID=1820329 RepID=A0ABV7TLL8_9RHOB
MANKTIEGAATQEGALKKNALAVLGIFGPENDLNALVRFPNGRVETVTRGERAERGTIVAIDREGIVVQRNGQARRIPISGG